MRRTLGALAVLLLAVTACTTEPGSAPAPVTSSSAPASGGPAGASPSAAPAGTPSPTPRTPPATPTPRPEPTPRPHPISMAALAERRYDGRDLRVGRSLGDVGPYERFLVSYRGDGLTISGVMAVPDGKGPFPVLVLNHGYIDPRTYFPGQGMPREMDFLARQGYVVLHTDYRDHAGSDRDDDVDHQLRLPYTVDTINAVKAVKSSGLRYLDADRVGWLGRSMGGEVTLRALAAQPGLVDAAVVYASTSSLAAENWEQFYRGDGDRAATNRRIDRTYGLPDDSPAFWRAASARSAFDRVTEPVLVHHGTEDDTCPPRWARATVRALEAEGVDVTLRMYAGEGHTFEGRWQTSIERTAAFFAEHLD
ncbi:Prolyl oligopeptidase family protein [Friedmanniella luteola]|uniref:Prolyl oligopeptidase family protein n=1 Tax=Friedmanniella luteola TaxID=546871 RepID=A0A1H1L5Y6_9ACTN|nr:alpha/beta fold hydrolase [Friedmanniella luteola]SDR70004.1 Prolyl oligopeptidase family protein [Friedmanniella luteola]